MISINKLRIGNGFDIHKLVNNRDLVLGGIKIDHPKGLFGHSDADVVIHSIMDALLGATGLSDIGTYFPDTHEKYLNIPSTQLLKEVVGMISNKNINIISIDVTIICQEPKLNKFIPMMKNNISEIIFNNIEVSKINIKATTTNNIGDIGSKNSIACLCVALISL